MKKKDGEKEKKRKKRKKSSIFLPSFYFFKLKLLKDSNNFSKNSEVYISYILMFN
jgi:hypothetical protein